VPAAALVPPSDHYRRICTQMGTWPMDDHPPTETGRCRRLIGGAECRTCERWLFRLGLRCDCQGEFKGQTRLCPWPRPIGQYRYWGDQWADHLQYL